MAKKGDDTDAMIGCAAGTLVLLGFVVLLLWWVWS